MVQHGDKLIRTTLQASTNKTFVTLPGVGTGAAQDLSGLAGYPAGVVFVNENVHTAAGGDELAIVAVNGTGTAAILQCKLNGAGGLEAGATPAVACAPGWQAVTFP
ncbi:hypothetical protein ACFQ9X_29990 [Catenulispora yoronensis]